MSRAIKGLRYSKLKPYVNYLLETSSPKVEKEKNLMTRQGYSDAYAECTI